MSGWLLPDWPLGLMCLFIFVLLFLVDQTVNKIVLGRMVNRTIDRKVFRFTSPARLCFSFSFDKDFSFTSLALLILVLLLVFYIGLTMHSSLGVGYLHHCIENLVEFSNHLWVLGG